MNNTAAQTPAARTQRFSSKSLSMGSLGTDQARYVIPVYQRPYAWTSVQVSQLMQDLLDFYRSPDIQSTYSLGTIVCDEETPGVFSILDGQQRLTTIDLLLEEISRRLDRPANEKHKRIISAYRYLSGMEANCESPLPACTEQRNRIAGTLTEFIERQGLREDLAAQTFLRALEACIHDRVSIRRVVIPLSDKVENEAPAMFEIINMRGQQLSALDILKSRLLSRFSEKDRFGRAFFTHLWRSTDERLVSPTEAAKGYDLKGWHSGQVSPSGSKDETDDTPISAALTIDEIIADADEAPLESGDQKGRADDSPKRKTDQPPAEDEGSREQFVPPIDMMNMLVIANELFKYDKARTADAENGSLPAYEALATTNFDRRFDHIVQAEAPGTADVWRLMGALSLVLQTVGVWGRYRQRENEAFEGAPDAFNQLIQTFMAASGFSASGQYWLLVLSATALEMSLGTDGKLPDSPEAFLAMKKPAFAKIRKIAQLRLLAWAYRAAEAGQARGAEGVFKLTAETPSENTAQTQLLAAQAAVEAAAPGWHYHDGTLSQFDLFLTDYVLWVDGHTGGNRPFAALKRAMDAFAEKAQSPEETELAGAFRAFNWRAFEEKARTLRIVARSDIEHWLARNRADLGKDADAAREELLRRHGFGNLALINESDNSSLGNGSPAGKAELVLKRMSNPTPKLLWLAVLSQQFPNLDGQHVEGLTELWASYIGEFSFG